MTNFACDLNGKVALVTGGTSGIGMAIAKQLAAAKATIILNDIIEAHVAQPLLTALQHDYGIKAFYHKADISKSAEIKNMFDTTVASVGGLDILVNNAGIQHVAAVTDFSDEKWDAIIAVNLTSCFKTIRAALPYMQAKQWGRIINIASTHGLVASPFKSAYVAAKHGLIGLTKTVALEMAQTPITCNAVCPGYVKTPLVDKQIAEQAQAHGIAPDRVIKDIILKAQPNKQFIEGSHIGDMVVFLAGPSAQGMTGEVLTMSGGWVAQ